VVGRVEEAQSNELILKGEFGEVRF